MRLVAEIGKIPASARWLGFAGLLPFWLPLIAIYGGGFIAPERGLMLLMVYAAIILSFLGGIRWGGALKQPRGPVQSTLFVFSVVPSLASYTALVLPAAAGLTLLLCSFLVQGVWDVQSAQRGDFPAWFATLRAVLSLGAVMALAAGLAARLLS